MVLLPQEYKGMVAGLQCATPLKMALLLYKEGLVKTTVPITVCIKALTEVLYGHDLFIDKFPVWLYLINELTIVWYGHDNFIDKVPVWLYLQNKLTIVRYGHDIFIDKVPVRLYLQNKLAIVRYDHDLFIDKVR